jgi:high-affinity K+ transport system ATPase subunit B
LKLVLTYFTGGASYSVPNELSFTYILTQLRFIFLSYVITYYFAVPYTVLTMVTAVLLADFRFFIDFSDYIDAIMGVEDEDDDDEEY